MKTITKLAAATVLVLSAALPAFADEQDTLAERNTFLSAQGGRQIAQPSQRTQRVSRRVARGVNAFAYDPASAAGPDAFGILSQH